MAPTTRLSFSVTAPGMETVEYTGDLFQHRELGPVLAAMAMMQTLFSTMETESEQTVFAEMRMALEGRAPVVLRDVASGANGPMRMIMDFLSIYYSLLNNPFAFPLVDEVDFDFRLEDAWNQQVLEEVNVESREAVAGEPLAMTVRMRDYMGETITRRIEVPIPAGTGGEVLLVEIVDAAAANQSWQTNKPGPFYIPRPDARNVDDILNEIRDRQGFQAFYVRVFRESDGIQMRGTDLEGLPPSILASITSPKTAEVMRRSNRMLMWERAFPTMGEYSGRYTLRVEVTD